MILRLEHIRRHELRDHPDWRYAFGDNVERVGLAGQAKEMRGEPNAIGIATKYSPWAYFNDGDMGHEVQCDIIKRDMKPLFRAVLEYRTIVIPAAGIGTGLAELSKHAPRTNHFLIHEIARLIEFDRSKNPVERVR